jgi:uncharacterized coiled-coil protein SlyX
MNSVVEKLAAIEKEIAAIQPKMAPLTERIADLDQKVAGFAQTLTGIAEESAAVKQDIELTRQGLTRIQTLIGESKAESEQLVAGQEENLQRCETMTAVFGAAFQAVSQFFEAAQRMGLADQAKTVFKVPSIAPPAAAPLAAKTQADAETMPVGQPQAEPVPEEPPKQRKHMKFASDGSGSSIQQFQHRSGDFLSASKPIPAEPPMPEPVPDDAWGMIPNAIPNMDEIEAAMSAMPPMMDTPMEAPFAEPPLPEPLTPEPPAVESPEPEPVPDDAWGTIPEANVPEPAMLEPPVIESPEPEPVTPEPPMPELLPELPELPAMEPLVTTPPPVLSESDFDSVDSGDSDFGDSNAGDGELASWSVPGLPDVAALPEMDSAQLEEDHLDSESDAEPSHEMASQLEVPPLNLATPALPEQSVPEDISEEDEQEIEDLLATMMTPVTA